MTTAADIDTLAAAARESVVPVARQTLVSPSSPWPQQSATPSITPPRFELYHIGFSICSHKVRAVLNEKQATWLSHELDPTKDENYRPDYVRLRLASDAARSFGRTRDWRGISSVKEVGFDALVVPTLVDHGAGRVVADSMEICLYLARALDTGADLLPADLETDILAEIATVDSTPHVALLYGANPEGDTRPLFFRHVFKTAHKAKATSAEKHWRPIKGQDSALDEAYDAKITKWRTGASFVGSPERMREAIASVDSIVGAFADVLRARDGDWIFGDRFTMADTFWGISLFRLQYLGYAWLWRDDHKRAVVQNYADRAFAREAINIAVAKWPTHPWARPVAGWMRRPSLGDRVMGLGT